MLSSDSWQKLLDILLTTQECLVSLNHFSPSLGCRVVWLSKWALCPDAILVHLPLSPSPVLFAMKEDNEKVPTLLTDYILKGKSSPRPAGAGDPPELPSPRTPAAGVAHTLQPPRASAPDQAGQGQAAQEDNCEGLAVTGPCLWRLLGSLRKRFQHCGVTRLHVKKRPQQQKIYCQSSGEFGLFLWEKQSQFF